MQPNGMELWSNEDIAKALDTSSLAPGGQLNRQQQDKFVKFLLTYASMLNPGSGIRVRTVRQKSGQLDKMWLHGPVTVGAARAYGQNTEALAEGGGSGDVAQNLARLYDTAYERFGTQNWDAVKVVARMAMTTEMLRENIEGQALEPELRRRFLARMATDFEDLAVNGDTSITEQSDRGYLLRINDGWDKLTDSATKVDAAGSFVSRATWISALKSMPRWIRQNQRDLKWFFNNDIEQDWLDLLGGRMDSAGTAALGGTMMNPLGIPYQVVPVIPSDKPLTVTEATPATIFGVRNGPFTFTEGSMDVLRIDIDNAGAVNIDFGVGGGGAPAALALSKFTRVAPEVCAIINAQYAAAHGATFANIARPDVVWDRINLVSPSTGATSEVEVQVAAGANQAATANLLGLGANLNLDDLFNDIQTVIGEDAGTNTIRQGTFTWLASPENFTWIAVTSDRGASMEGIRAYSEFNKDRDRIEMIVFAFLDALVEDPQSIVKIVNQRTQSLTASP